VKIDCCEGFQSVDILFLAENIVRVGAFGPFDGLGMNGIESNPMPIEGCLFFN
jgi:hypothetical protein